MIKDIDLKDVSKYLSYNKETGLFIWLDHFNKPEVIGKTAGSKSIVHGYIIIGYKLRQYKGHQLAFFFMTGRIPKEIDHINGIRYDNRWKNLREVTRSENQQNRVINCNNSYGIKGLTFINSKKQLWVGQISNKGTRHKLTSKDKEKVINWLKITRESLHKGYTNHGNY